MKKRYSIEPKGTFSIWRSSKTGLSLLAAGAFLSSPLLADSPFLIESGRSTDTAGQNRDWISLTPDSTDHWFNSTGPLNVQNPPVTAPGSLRFGLTTEIVATLTPIMPNPGGTWTIFTARPVTSVVEGTAMLIETTGGSGLPEKTTAFVEGDPNVWNEIGTFILDENETTPTITFSWDPENPTPPGFGNRMYANVFLFVPAESPCLDIPEVGRVHGPLAENQEFVDVPDVSEEAAAVTVYADGVQIGQLTEGVVEGVNRVATSPLVKDQRIVATQTIGEVEGCVPAGGPRVGGGPNPAIRVNFVLRHHPDYEGPIGVEGDPEVEGNAIYILGSTGAPGFLSAPGGGTTIWPFDNCWQTIMFDHTANPEYPLTGATAAPGTFAVLDGIAIAIEEPDTGPYRIYIDNVMNGLTVVEDFESVEVGTENYFFRQPGFSGTTSGRVLAAPNVSVVTDENADTGTRSALIYWQFRDHILDDAWLRLSTFGAEGRSSPLVDLSQPISIRMLVLPVGETEGALRLGRIPDKVRPEGETVTFLVEVFNGDGDLWYQWRKDGMDIFGADEPELTLENITEQDAGVYSIFVTDGFCNVEEFSRLSIGVEPPSEIAASLVDGLVVLTWEGDAVLQAAGEVTGPWDDVVGATSGYTVDPALAPMQYFRLRAAQ